MWCSALTFALSDDRKIGVGRPRGSINKKAQPIKAGLSRVISHRHPAALWVYGWLYWTNKDTHFHRAPKPFGGVDREPGSSTMLKKRSLNPFKS